jgi:drug/metabolite transporter (DMT)-like permease
MLLRSLPLLFALLWSTGFIGARYGLPYIGPFSFLAIRLIIALLVLAVIIKCCKLKFPRLHLGYLHVFGSGLLIHVAYLGGVFYAIKSGLPVGQTAMIVGCLLYTSDAADDM